jgi:hypothetical protein
LRCERGLKCLRNDRKEWDEDRATFRDKPIHNWASHGDTGLRGPDDAPQGGGRAA